MDCPHDELRLFVGPKRADYYLKKWKSARQPLSRSGWNWAAFFLTVFWLGYRKMYGWVFLLFGFFIFMDIALQQMNPQSGYNSGTGLLFSLVLGFFGNALYYKHALKKIAQAKQEYATKDDQLTAITQKGGTSSAGVWLVILLYMVEIAVYELFVSNRDA